MSVHERREAKGIDLVPIAQDLVKVEAMANNIKSS
jgi:hypothetical protein